MRAPPESFRPTTGAPSFIARSMIFTIFAALVSDSEPPKTVKSCAKAKTGRPSTRPWPATTPSPGIELLVHAEVAAAVGDELVELLERAGIEQQLDPLARGQLAGVVLALEALLAAAELGAPLEVGEMSDRIHVMSIGSELTAASPSRPAPSPSPSGTSRGRCRSAGG